MFDIGWSEFLVIAVVALIAIGPKELPAVLRTMGQWMTKIRRMASEFQGQFQEAMREAEMADLKKHADDLRDAAKSLTAPLSSSIPTTGAFDFLSDPVTPPKTETATETTTPSSAAESLPVEPALPEAPHTEASVPPPALAEALPTAPAEPQAPKPAP